MTPTVVTSATNTVDCSIFSRITCAKSGLPKIPLRCIRVSNIAQKWHWVEDQYASLWGSPIE